MNTTYSLTHGQRIALAVLSSILFYMFLPQLAMAAAWGETGVNDPTLGTGTSTGFWNGINAVGAVIYGVMWLVATIVLGMGAFKIKNGDAAGAMWCFGGGAVFGVIPLFVQWIRSL
jgi:hypothetical protein